MENWTGSCKCVFEILKERRPSKMWLDNGREFYNNDVQKLNEDKSWMIKRFNRTIKEKMFKYFSANNTRKCVYVIDLLIDQTNNTIHSSIKMTSKEASRK